MLIGRTVLLVLVGIHWILPFTPANRHEAVRIIVGSLVLGAAFVALFVRTYSRPTQAFAVAAALLVAVFIVSAVTGASPLSEGAVVKVVFLAGLGWATLRTLARAR